LLHQIDSRLGVEVRSPWRLAERGRGRATVARSVFERLEASGFRELKVRLTAEARAHAFATAVPAQFTASVAYGRGERKDTAVGDLNVPHPLTCEVIGRDRWLRTG
jgi:hypothetical protein